MVGTPEQLCDPKCCSLSEAIRIARQRYRENQSFDMEIAQFLNHQWLARRVNPEAVERALEILGAIAAPGRLFAVMRAAMSQNDPGVLSKAALALAKHVDNLPVLEKLLTNGDARVRANTIEALWGRKMPEVESMLVRALSDQHHRVAINAAYALYLVDPVKYLSRVEAFVSHGEPAFRTAAAWLIQRIGDSRHLLLLKQLVRDENPEVRRAAFRTLGALRGGLPDKAGAPDKTMSDKARMSGAAMETAAIAAVP